MKHIPVKLPDTMTREDVGPYLLGLRKHFGLSEQDVSDRLQIRVRYVRAIEAGDFAQLPTIVYARGYVHTYAEFLGLDADQVVERCLGEDAPAPTPLLPQTLASRRSDWSKWRGGAMLGAVGAVMILIAAQLYERGDASGPEPVAAVPDTVLGVMRTMMMPMGESRDCFSGKVWSACMVATRGWQMVANMQSPAVNYEGYEPLSPFALALTLSTSPLPETADDEVAPSVEKKPKKADDGADVENTEAVEPAR